MNCTVHTDSITRTHRQYHTDISHTYIQTVSHVHTDSLTRTHRQSHTYTQSYTYTQTVSHVHTDSLTRTHRQSHTYTQTVLHVHTDSLTRTHRQSHTNTQNIHNVYVVCSFVMLLLLPTSSWTGTLPVLFYIHWVAEEPLGRTYRQQHLRGQL